MRHKIKNLVNDLITKYNTNNPYTLIEALGGIIVYVPLKGVRGFYQNYHDVDIVYLDENMSKKNQRIVCSHELGHMLLHKHKNYFFLDLNSYESTEKYEHQANIFSAELLISDDDLKSTNDITADQLATLLGVDERLVYIKYMNYLFLADSAS